MTNIKSSINRRFVVPKLWKTSLSVLFFIATALGASQVSAQNTIINGVGEYTEFNKATLLIKLDLGVPTNDAMEAISLDAPKQLSFRVLEDRTARRWAQLWIQSLSINSPPSVLTKQTDDLIAMTQAIPANLKQGDLVEFERVANDLTLMIVDGVEVAEFQTPEFFEFLLSAFIGPIPPSSELKSALLQAGDIDSNANTLFNSLSYTLERSDIVAAWLEPEEEEISEEEIAEAEQEAAEETAAAEALAVAEAVVEEVVEAVAVEEPAAPVEVVAAPEPAPAPEPEPEPEEAPILITAESLLAVQNYQREMLVKIYQNIEYPAAAQRRNREGSLRIAVSVNQDGSLNNVDLLQQADYEGFNDAAMAAVDSASPFTNLPDTVLDLPMVVEIPIQFRLQ